MSKKKREFEPINHLDIQDVWNEKTALIFERLFEMHLKDEEAFELITNRPPVKDRAGDSAYRRRCQKWGISTKPRMITKDPNYFPEYNERAALQQRVRDQEAKAAKCEAERDQARQETEAIKQELASVRTQLAQAAIIERSDFNPGQYDTVSQAVRALLEIVRPALGQKRHMADWMLSNLCDDCIKLLEQSISSVREQHYCPQCKEQFEHFLTYARSLRSKSEDTPSG